MAVDFIFGAPCVTAFNDGLVDEDAFHYDAPVEQSARRVLGKAPAVFGAEGL